jgi:hypothetical protein
MRLRRTTPLGSRRSAFTGHASTHGGSSHCRQITGSVPSLMIPKATLGMPRWL